MKGHLPDDSPPTAGGPGPLARTIRRRTLFTVAGQAAGSLVTAACGLVEPPTPTRSPRPTPAAAQGVTPTAGAEPARSSLRWMAAGDSWQRPFNEWAIAEWSKLNPTLPIEPIWTDGQTIPQRALASTLAGAGASSLDVIVMGIENIPALIPINLAAPIDLPDADQFAREQLNVVSRDGKLYGIPWFVDVIGYYYNKRLYREAGLDPDKPAATLDDLVEYSTRLTRGGLYGLTYSVKKDWGLPTAEWLCLLYALGGYPLTENTDAGRPTLNTPTAVKALQFWVDLRLKHKVLPPDVQEADGDVNSAAFKNGRIAGWSVWHAAMPDFTTDPKRTIDARDIGFGPTPYRNAETGRTSTWSGGWTVMVGAGTRQRGAATEFARFLTAPAAQKHMALTMARCARQSTFNDAEVLARWPHLKVVGELSQVGRVRPVTKHWLGLNEEIMNVIGAAVGGQLSPQQALDQAQQKAESVWAIG